MGAGAGAVAPGKTYGAGVEGYGTGLLTSPGQGHAGLPNPLCGQVSTAQESSWLENSGLGHTGGEHQLR